MSKISELRSRLPLKAIIPILLISTLCIVSFASSSTIAPATTYKALEGATVSVTGDYEVTPVGFSLAADQMTGHSAWSSSDPLCTEVNAGDWTYSLTVLAKTTTPATVSVTWSQNGGDYVDMGSITISTAPVSGNTATFIFDTGYTHFDSPVGIIITVA